MSTHGSNIQDKLTPRLSACAQDTYRLLGVLEEDFGRVGDALLLLGRGARSVDTRGGLGGVTTHKAAK